MSQFYMILNKQLTGLFLGRHAPKLEAPQNTPPVPTEAVGGKIGINSNG